MSLGHWCTVRLCPTPAASVPSLFLGRGHQCLGRQSCLSHQMKVQLSHCPPCGTHIPGIIDPTDNETCMQCPHKTGDISARNHCPTKGTLIPAPNVPRDIGGHLVPGYSVCGAMGHCVQISVSPFCIILNYSQF